MATLVSCIVDTDGTGDYLSINAAEADDFGATGGNLVSNDEYVECECISSSGSSDTQISLGMYDGFTTDATHYISLYVGDSSLHDGKYETQTSGGNYTYRLEPNSGDRACQIGLGYTRVEGFLIKANGSFVVYLLDQENHRTLKKCVVDANRDNRSFYGRSIDGDIVINNIFYNSGRYDNSISIFVESSSAWYHFLNNTIYHPSPNSRDALFGDPSDSNTLIQNNIWINEENNQDVAELGSATVSHNITSGTDSFGTNSLTEVTSSEVFVDAANSDFRNVDTSSAIDAGTDLSSDMDAVDIIGTSRPQGDAWDIGAFEYVSAGTTVAPTTTSPTTSAPTTAEPTTLAPTTLEPTTAAPTTLAPTTLEPTTTAPTTLAPTTTAPTTLAPTTLAPTTLAPTTLAPTTSEPTTSAPTTPSPTTLAPTTLGPTTLAPTTVEPTTSAPTTLAPTTTAPTTLEPTTLAPTTVAPTTSAPTTSAPTTLEPTTVSPTTLAPTTSEPTTTAPTTEVTTAAPTTLAPTTEAPTTAAPTTVAPTTVAPTTLAPTTLEPTSLAPTTLEPTTVAPTTTAPTTLAPTTPSPTTAEPTTLAPTSLAPTTLAPTTVEPTTLSPTTLEPTTIAPTTLAPTTVAPTTLAPTTIAPTTIITTLAPTTLLTTLAPTTAVPVVTCVKYLNSMILSVLEAVSDISSTFNLNSIITKEFNLNGYLCR